MTEVSVFNWIFGFTEWVVSYKKKYIFIVKTIYFQRKCSSVCSLIKNYDFEVDENLEISQEKEGKYNKIENFQVDDLGNDLLNNLDCTFKIDSVLPVTLLSCICSKRDP